MPTPNPLLDLDPGIGQVACSVRFDICSAASPASLPVIHPPRADMQIVNNPSAAVKRILRNFEVLPEEADQIDLFRDRVCPKLVLEDGTVWPLGEFLFVTEEFTVATSGRPLRTTLFDQTWLLTLNRVNHFGVQEGGDPVSAIAQLAYEVPALDPERFLIYQDGQVPLLDSPVSWPSGTSRMQMMNELAELAGYFSPYFDNHGNFVVRPIGDLAPSDDAHRYDSTHPRIVAGTYVKNPNRLQAPNVYVALNSGSQGGEIAGTYRIPSDEPNSVENRGIEIPEVIRSQGPNSAATAVSIAQARAMSDPKSYGQAQFTSPPDPRHDTYDVVVVDGDVYWEADWSMDLKPGGAHVHNLRRVLGDE